MSRITHDNTPWFTTSAQGTAYLAARLDLSNPDSGQITLTVRKQSTTTPDSVASTTRTLDAAVQRFGGQYESWSTYIVVAPRSQLRREKLEAMRARVPAPRRRSTIANLPESH